MPMKWLVRLIGNALIIFLLASVTDGWLISVNGFAYALLAAFVLGLVNAFIRPIVMLLSIPLRILTLGLFTFVVNALMLMLVSAVLRPNFEVMGFWRAVLAALIISVVSALLSRLVGEEK